MDSTPGAKGIMYTTWDNKYKFLAPFGDLVSSALELTSTYHALLQGSDGLSISSHHLSQSSHHNSCASGYALRPDALTTINHEENETTGK